MAKKQRVNGGKRTRIERVTRRRRSQDSGRYVKHLFDGRERGKLVGPLREFLRAYGIGRDANAAREAFAKRVGTSVQYLVQVGLGYRVPGEKLVIEIEKATHGLVRVEQLRPDVDWRYLESRKHPGDHAQLH